MPLSLKALLCCLFLASFALAQTSLVSGALAGSVSDSTGGRIPGATVTVRETATHQAREVSTDAEGGF
ncbi:MAG: carboxypeptidase-like regulatory domain-containing protein, partial [Bryobacteraceae bacterium]